MSSGHPAPRASDHDREVVVDRLREAAADGRLDMSEFHERMNAAYAARTRPELAPLLADLAEPGATFAPAAPATTGRIKGVLATKQRRGVWDVPGRLEVRLYLAAARLDLTRCTLAPRVDIRLSLVLSGLELVVPPEVRVDSDPATNVLSVVSDRRREADPSGSTVRILGHATLSTITLRTPNALTQWWRSVTNGR